MKLVVFSIDAYSHLGPLFLQYLNDKWPECPYEQVYIANHAHIDVPHPVVYVKDRDMNFGSRMRKFLEHYYTDDALMIMMIDYIPKNADHDLIVKAEEVLTRSTVGHVRLRPMPKPAHPWKPDSDFGVIDKRRPYSLSLQPGMWESQLLHDLCRNGENAWRTETHGSTRTRNFDKSFLSTMDVAISHHNYYRKRRVSPIPKNAAWRIKEVK